MASADVTASTSNGAAAAATPDLSTNAKEESEEDTKDKEQDKDKDRDKDKEDKDDDEENRAFECNICLDSARDAVISLCGHLFCWPCLHQWLDTRPNRQICPVCKAGISRDKVIPLYGRGGDNKDPRDKQVPPRPRGQRPEPEVNGAPAGGFFSPFNLGQGGNGFQMSFGIGAFPFGFFAHNFNFGGNPGGELGRGRGGGGAGGYPAEGTVQYEEEQFLHKVFLYVAGAFIFWLLIA